MQNASLIFDILAFSLNYPYLKYSEQLRNHNRRTAIAGLVSV